MDTSIFDMVIAGSGLYLIYAAWIMKKKGEIKKGVIVSKDVDVDKIRDKEGFIAYMFGKVLLIGILAVIVGAGCVLNTQLGGPSYLELAAVAVYLAVLIVFAAATTKARKKFID